MLVTCKRGNNKYNQKNDTTTNITNKTKVKGREGRKPQKVTPHAGRRQRQQQTARVRPVAASIYLCLVRDLAPALVVEPEDPRFDLATQAGLVHVVEGAVPGKNDVNDHAHAPHVHRLEQAAGEEGEHVRRAPCVRVRAPRGVLDGERGGGQSFAPSIDGDIGR